MTMPDQPAPAVDHEKTARTIRRRAAWVVIGGLALIVIGVWLCFGVPIAMVVGGIFTTVVGFAGISMAADEEQKGRRR